MSSQIFASSTERACRRTTGPRSSLRSGVALTAALSLLAPAWPVRAAPEGPDAKEAASNAPSTETGTENTSPDTTSALDAVAAPRSVDVPLTELPDPPPLAPPDPRPADMKALTALLDRLVSSDATEREKAAQELLEVKPQWVSALVFRLDAIAERSDKEAMKAELAAIRKKARDNEESTRKGAESPDYLLLALEHASPKKEAWQNLVRVLAISRMLGQIGSTPATRGIVRVYVRFGEFLRIDTQRQLAALGDRALGALIETRRHPAQKIAQWAERQLDLAGKSIPSEAVQTEDQEALADVLLAFGRIRDPDSARLIISFAQSERAQIRNAARQAVVLLGDVGTWQLRDAYENTVGKLPPRAWTWQRTARELFTEFDRLRQAKEYQLFDAGVAAQKQGNLDEMRAKFDRVLAFNPMFERRDEMARGYLDYARRVLDEKPEAALSALRRAERVSGDDKERRVIQSLSRTLAARALLAEGLADQGLLNEALALDPSNHLAEQTLGSAAAGGKPVLASRTRHLAALVIAGVSLLAAASILLVALWRRRSHLAAQPAQETTAAPVAPTEPNDEPPRDAPADETVPDDEPPQDELPSERTKTLPQPRTDDSGERPNADEPPDSPQSPDVDEGSKPPRE